MNLSFHLNTKKRQREKKKRQFTFLNKVQYLISIFRYAKLSFFSLSSPPFCCLRLGDKEPLSLLLPFLASSDILFLCFSVEQENRGNANHILP